MVKVATFLDTETTGLSNNDKVIELASLMFIVDGNSYEYIGHVHIYNKVDVVISAGAQRVHGISPKKLEQLSGGKSYTQYIQEVYGLLGIADYVFGHNISFDKRLISNTYGNCFKPEVQFFDTMDSAKYYFGKRMPLDEIAKQTLSKFGMAQDSFSQEFKTLNGEGGYHSALYDAYVMTRVYMLLNDRKWIYPDT